MARNRKQIEENEHDCNVQLAKIRKKRLKLENRERQLVEVLVLLKKEKEIIK